MHGPINIKHSNYSVPTCSPATDLDHSMQNYTKMH